MEASQTCKTVRKSCFKTEAALCLPNLSGCFSIFSTTRPRSYRLWRESRGFRPVCHEVSTLCVTRFPPCVKSIYHGKRFTCSRFGSGQGRLSDNVKFTCMTSFVSLARSSLNLKYFCFSARFWWRTRKV